MITVYKIDPPALEIHQCHELCCRWKRLYDEVINRFLIDRLDGDNVLVTGLKDLERSYNDLFENPQSDYSEDEFVRTSPNPVAIIYETDEDEF